MRIIGIDPGTGILGFGVIDVTKDNKVRMVTGGVITTPAHTPLDERLEEIFDGLTDIIAETKPEVMSIEKLFFSQNVTTAISVAQARGVAAPGTAVPRRTRAMPPGTADSRGSAQDGGDCVSASAHSATEPHPAKVRGITGPLNLR